MYSRVSDTWVLVILCVFQEFEDLSKQETVHMYEDFLDSCVIEPFLFEAHVDHNFNDWES